MGKKGSKRKTRWRVLSIGAPPSGEDEEDGLRNGYVKGQQNDRSSHGFDRNGQVGYKSRRNTVDTNGSSGYTNSTSKSRRDESTGSQSKSNVIFNEDEYTKITAPRQDVLFKKSYLSCKKPWASNAMYNAIPWASTSATPSTTESQSASHSTAGRDGSEMTEDQQLLDGYSAMGEYPPRGIDPEVNQVGYGTFYNHNSGYYYGYPVMLVGPAPVPTQMEPSVLAAIPCSSVPLRPIEWVNPAFVPKLSGESYCLINNKVHYQSGQAAEIETTEPEEHSNTTIPIESSNETWNNSGTGSVSYSGSMTGEVEEQEIYETNETKEETVICEDNLTEKMLQDIDQGPVVEEIEENNAPYLNPIVLPQPTAIHVPHVIPAIPEPYMYPGHYMFGPPLVNVNGVTIQGELTIRTTNITKMTSASHTKRGRKRTKWRQRRAVSSKAEDDEVDYSSDCKSGLSFSRTSWSTCPTATRSTTTTTVIANRPLNPECEEFHLRTETECDLSIVENPSATLEETAPLLRANTSSLEIAEGEISSNIGNNSESKYNNNPCKDTTSTEELRSEGKDNNYKLIVTSVKANQEVINSSTNAKNRLIDYLCDDNERVNSSKETEIYMINDARTESNEASQRTDINNVADTSFSANILYEQAGCDLNNFSTKLHVERDKEALSNGQVQSNRSDDDVETIQSNPNESMTIMKNGDLSETSRSSRSSSSQRTNESTNFSNNVDIRQYSSDSSSTRVSTKKKYNVKTLRLVKEPVPCPTSSDECDTNVNIDKVTQADDSTQLESTGYCIIKDIDAENRVPSESASDIGNDNVDNKTASEDVAECSNDSGFETQTRRPVYHITEAVTEWLQRANTPDIFITATMISDSSDTDDEDLKDEPSKNLQGNPMPALSVNSMIDDRVSSCMPNYSKFAKINNIEEDRQSDNINNDHQSKNVTLRITTHDRGSKTRSIEKSGRKTMDRSDEHSEKGILSSSDSFHRQEFTGSTTTTLRKRRKEFCEFTEKDSIADMRVATNSRINSKRIATRRIRRSDKSTKRPTESLDVKIRRRDEGKTDDARCMVSVKTFEKGEIVVSVDGKFMQISPFPQLLHYIEPNVSENEKKTEESDRKIPESSEEIEMKRIEKKTRSNVMKDEIDNKMTASLISIEEPDVLECWEVETIEPITPKRMLQSHGVSYEGEAAEEEHFHTESGIVEYVQKYYRLARENATSIEDDTYKSKINVLLNTKPFNKSRMMPNSPVELIRGYQGEEIPVVMPNENCGTLEERKIPVDEAFEVYEHCYTDKAQSFTLDSIFKTQPLFHEEGEGPVPCRPVCCSIQ